MFGCGVLWGRPCCAIAGEANNAAMAATDKIAFIFNLLFRIVGGGGVFIRITPADKRAFFILSISQIRPSGGGRDGAFALALSPGRERLANATCFDAEIVPWHAGGGFPPLA